jgi:flavin-dependent dehydrogenase
MILPKNPVQVSKENEKLAKKIFVGNNSATDYKTLQKEVRAENETIPSMFNAYIGLTDTMRMFGSIYDEEFGNVYETGIMITMADLLETKRKRYIEPYKEYLRKVLEERRAAKRLAKENRIAERIAKKISKTDKKKKKNK